MKAYSQTLFGIIKKENSMKNEIVWICILLLKKKQILNIHLITMLLFSLKSISGMLEIRIYSKLPMAIYVLLY